MFQDHEHKRHKHKHMHKKKGTWSFFIVFMLMLKSLVLCLSHKCELESSVLTTKRYDSKQDKLIYLASERSLVSL